MVRCMFLAVFRSGKRRVSQCRSNIKNTAQPCVFHCETLRETDTCSGYTVLINKSAAYFNVSE